MTLKALRLSLLWLFLSVALKAQPVPRTTYFHDAVSSGTFMHDDVRLYYEVYGSGEPLLIVHGNGGSIADLKAQLAFFRTHYKVIAMDSRDQGRSGESSGPMNYEVMTADLVALLDHLHVSSTDVLGWSDGAIEALELGMYHPTRVKKIAAMAANLDPDGAVPEVVALVKRMIASRSASAEATGVGRRALKVTQMLLDEPHIPATALERIAAPTLILASDHDVIRDEHTLEIYHHIANSELIIFPDATHLIPFDDPVSFNMTVDHFLTTPFAKVDRIRDTMTSLEKLRASER